MMFRKKLLTLAIILGITGIAVYNDKRIDLKNLATQMAPEGLKQAEPALEENEITPEQFSEINTSAPEIKIFDVRFKEEYDEGHVENAIFLPLSHITVEKLTELNIKPEQQIYLYSWTDLRSQKAAEVLNSLGYPNIKVLKGGMEAWRGYGYPIVSSEPQ